MAERISNGERQVKYGEDAKSETAGWLSRFIQLFCLAGRIR